MWKKVLVVLSMSLQISLFADMTQGEMLERQLWEDIAAGKWDTVKNQLAPGFQLINNMGAHDKSELDAIIGQFKAANLSFSDFKVTESQNVLIITYILQSKITMGEKCLISKDTRLSVWQKNDGVWQWVAYANVTPGGI
jgi:hypothetical protein